MALLTRPDLVMASPGGMRPGAGRPVVIAHRGASGYLPEHTVAAYELAARQGADYLEADLVLTRDGHLVVRHENELSSTTDIASRPELAHLCTTKVVGGRRVTGWFSEDLTLEQVKTLRAVERLPHLRTESHARSGELTVPTFAELLRLRERLALELGRPIGVYVELKVPGYFAAHGQPLEEPFVAALRAAGLDEPDAPVVIQCFELTSLRTMRRRMGVVAPMVLLTEIVGGPQDLAAEGGPRTWAELLLPESLQRLGADIDGIGPDKRQVIPWDQGGELAAPTSLVEDAHRAGLAVHVWTLRAENQFLPSELRVGADPRRRGDARAEVRAYLEVGVDGIFTDHTDIAVDVVGAPATVTAPGVPQAC